MNVRLEPSETDSTKEEKRCLFAARHRVPYRDALPTQRSAPSVGRMRKEDDDDDDDDDVDDEEQREDISTIARGIHHVESSEKSVH